MILKTNRLKIKKASESDAGMYLKLWTDPRVMTNVGFSGGLKVTEAEIREQLLSQSDSVFNRLLVVQKRDSGVSVGECCIHFPDEKGIAGTDVKLLPEYWGNGFGVEIKRGLLDYLFTNTDCLAVEASPNVNNPASIRMQESVGGVRKGEAVYRFPEEMAGYTAPVHHYVYQVTREAWEKLS